MSDTLKLRGDEPVLPGLSLPEAFESLDRRLESSIKLCKLDTAQAGHVLSVISICQELQRLLKCALVENGILASRIEILVNSQMESTRKINTKLQASEMEHKVTRKHIKRLRKRISVHDTVQRKRNQKWWNVNVRSTDYDSFRMLSRTSGSPDLEFVLRINQILVDFVADHEKTELVLPPMGQDERAEVSKLASIYKIRCRYGKSNQVAASTLIKARQTSIPGHGEVDAILDGFARVQNLKRLSNEGGSMEEPKTEGPVPEDTSSGKGTSQSPTVLSIPPTMLTPLSLLASSSVDMSCSVNLTPAQSPPNSGLSTPTNDPLLVKGRKDTCDRVARSHLHPASSQSCENPLPISGYRAPASSGGKGPSSNGSTSVFQAPPKSSTAVGTSIGVGGVSSGGGVAAGTMATTVGSLVPPSVTLLTKHSVTSPKPSQHLPSNMSGGHIPHVAGGVAFQQQQQQQHIGVRPISQPTVVASPLKVPVSQLPHAVQHNLCSWSGGGGDGSRVGVSAGGGDGRLVHRESGFAGGDCGEEGGGTGRREPMTAAVGVDATSPPKRMRLTRKAAAGMATNED